MSYALGAPISNRFEFHGEWNYRITPRQSA
jgi:hypothetical protein